MVRHCFDCDQKLEEECGIDGHEIYDDSFCGQCAPGECDGCSYQNCEQHPANMEVV
jgi:hypothetical protein